MKSEQLYFPYGDAVQYVLHAPDYKLSLRGTTGEERELALQGCHERSARRLMDLCFTNGGIYIKASASLGHEMKEIIP